MAMNIFNNSATFTRSTSTSAYSSGQLVANSLSAGSVVPMSIPVGGYAGVINMRLTRARLIKSSTVSANAQFRVHIYSRSPVSATGDQGNWTTDNAANWLADIDITQQAFTDGCSGAGSLASGSEAFLKVTNAGAGLSQQNLFCLLEARAGYVPTASETFTLILEEVAAW